MLKFLSYICAFFLLAAPAYGKTFKIATVSPDGTRWMNELNAGADEIKTRTQGRVKFRFYPGGVMGNDKSVLRKIRAGQLQGGAITGGGLLEIYPDSQIYNIPLVFRSHEEVDYVRSHMDQLIIDGLRDAGYISFGLSEGGFAYLMSDTPLAGVDDIKHKKVWTPEGDQFSRSAFQAIGVSPISLPLTDVLTGLQTGLIDTIASSPMGAIALQWHTKVKYVTTTPLMYLYGTLIIDRKAFEKLSAADQAIVSEVMKGVFKRLDEINREDNQKASKALKNQGIVYVDPSKDQQTQWRAAVRSAMEKLVNEKLVSKEMAQTLNTHLQNFRESSSH